jgi:hypothetical protein
VRGIYELLFLADRRAVGAFMLQPLMVPPRFLVARGVRTNSASMSQWIDLIANRPS